jgi:hypothetical protein
LKTYLSRSAGILAGIGKSIITDTTRVREEVEVGPTDQFPEQKLNLQR